MLSEWWSRVRYFVAGKKRAPTKQWANASVKGSAANTSASAKARKHL